MIFSNLNFLDKRGTWEEKVKESLQTLKKILTPISKDIMSLANYILFFNPPYIALNSLNTNVPSNLVNTENFIQTIKYKVDNKEQTVDLYIANALKYREGFINFSPYGDAFLVSKKAKDKYLIINSNGVYFKKESDGTFTITATIEPNFKSGDICLAYNYLKGDQDVLNNTNTEKDNIENYLVYPAGTGSYFNLLGLSNSIQAICEDNATNSFIREQSISLSPFALRFYLKKETSYWDNTELWQKTNIASSDDQTVYISDKDDNLWLGQPIYTEIVTNEGESIYFDMTEKISNNVTRGRNYFTLSLFSNGGCTLPKKVQIC